jgi:Lsr2
MARTAIVATYDDLDGTEIDGHGGTILFSLDGEDYEIDLSQANQARFSEAMAPYIRYGRLRTCVSRRSRRGSRRGTRRVGAGFPVQHRTLPARTDMAQIRHWAKQEGYNVDDKEPLPEAVIGKYDQCHSAPAASGDPGAPLGFTSAGSLYWYASVREAGG